MQGWLPVPVAPRAPDRIVDGKHGKDSRKIYVRGQVRTRNRLGRRSRLARCSGLLCCLSVDVTDQLLDLLASAFGTRFSVTIMIAECFGERELLFALLTLKIVSRHGFLHGWRYS